MDQSSLVFGPREGAAFLAVLATLGGIVLWIRAPRAARQYLDLIRAPTDGRLERGLVVFNRLCALLLLLVGGLMVVTALTH